MCLSLSKFGTQNCRLLQPSSSAHSLGYDFCRHDFRRVLTMDFALLVARRAARNIRTKRTSVASGAVIGRTTPYYSVIHSSTNSAVLTDIQKNHVPIATECKALHPDRASKYSLRSHTCGELRASHEGSSVRLCGWVEFTRHDQFLILRDAYGRTQIIIPKDDSDLQKKFNSLPLESTVQVEGTVILRPTGQQNSKMPTGEVEVVATNLTVLGFAPSCLPFNIRKYQEPTEKLQMQYRYLYLRFPKIQQNLRLRAQFLHNIREFLVHQQFVDVETPTLFRKTPGGAQEFVVPTQNPGLYYSLVQSPQQFKQLLMVGGLDRYFQIARCYRDESVRPDRQPEFTQLDIELSFVDREGILSLIEDLLLSCWPAHLPRLQLPLPRMTFHDAVNKYGSDKPDTRFGCQISNLTHMVESKDIKFNGMESNTDKPKFSVRSVVFRGNAPACNRAVWEELRKKAQEEWGSTQLLLISVKQRRDVTKSLSQIFSDGAAERLAAEIQAEKGDLLILGVGPESKVLSMMGALRVRVADRLEAEGLAVRSEGYHFLWVVDFPLFEEGDDGLESAHHPFTQPHPDDVHLLDTDPLKVRGLHYDLVLNGAEVGGGSIRISDADLQMRILQDLLRVDPSSLRHLLDALSMGCPPHGGIALGLDRLVAIICGAKSIREVIAFPKGISGKDSMSGAPAPLTREDAVTYKLPFPQQTKPPSR